ncbi:hypothetical protein [Microbacterium sp. Se5.02b]|uniref:hypothetical protein n=1 Tax=Microbacterium sp. Se5.02b TaxID=2864103 RepID=UPI001C68758C|nr:hypothetical protein [Microbacterium sp. Se5.02b]QYM64030.1 hypothetical protein K1X59_18325 [Microbacterium sp. Se5.02b]
MASIRTTLHLTHEIQNEDRYVRVPFDVPRGTDSLEVRISYDAEAAVIDLGCEGAAGGADGRAVHDRTT